MRSIVLVAALLGCLSLTACNDKPAAPTAEAAAPKKSQARPAPLYAGQEQVQSIQSGTVTSDAGGGLNLAAKVTTDGAGWTQVGFLPRIYAGSPPDGIYEIDVVAQKPATPGASGATTVEAKAAWDKYKDGRVKGVKFLSKTNEVVAMLGAK
jgi:hypothetical protein